MLEIFTELFDVLWDYFLLSSPLEQVILFGIMLFLVAIFYLLYKNGTNNIKLLIDYGKVWAECLPDGITQEEADLILKETEPVILMLQDVWLDIKKSPLFGTLKLALKIILTDFTKKIQK